MNSADTALCIFTPGYLLNKYGVQQHPEDAAVQLQRQDPFLDVEDFPLGKDLPALLNYAPQEQSNKDKRRRTAGTYYWHKC